MVYALLDSTNSSLDNLLNKRLAGEFILDTTFYQ